MLSGSHAFLRDINILAMKPVTISERFIEWCTELPSFKDSCLFSSIFVFRGVQCRLRIVKYRGQKDMYLVCLDNVFSGEFKPANLVTYLACNNYDSFSMPHKVTTQNSNYCIWEGIIPSQDLTTMKKFLILFVDDDDRQKPVLPKTDHKLVQTESQSHPISCLEALSQDLGKLLDEDANSHDVVLKRGDGIVKAHKILLSSRSKVFEAMFRSDMVEGQTGQVELKDMDADVLQEFVRYMYTGTVPELGEDKAKRLYEAGDLYAVGSLMRLCSTYLTQQLTTGNACDILELADAHSDPEFKERVITYILKEKIPLKDEQWKLFSARCPLVALDVANRFIKLQFTA